jgi:hypothetical protein
MSSPPNTASYDNALNTLGGGGSRRRRNKRRHHSRQAGLRNQKQNGGFFPGLGGIVQQALVPFGLYAMQHSLKNRKSSGNRSFINKTITPASFKRNFTRSRR